MSIIYGSRAKATAHFLCPSCNETFSVPFADVQAESLNQAKIGYPFITLCCPFCEEEQDFTYILPTGRSVPDYFQLTYTEVE